MWGSITIDEDLLDAAEYDRGRKRCRSSTSTTANVSRLISLRGSAAAARFCLNGPAARRCVVGDVVIIISYALLDFEEAKGFKPWVVFPDTATNKLVR